MGELRAKGGGERLTTNCPVCLSVNATPFQTVDRLKYWRCPECLAAFVDASGFLDVQAERARYLLHENDPEDAGYRGFLNRLAKPLMDKLEPGREGLDYGCGPGPALARMLTEAGHTVRLYDPFFHPDASALERTYDFIVCTETVEHFHRPAREFARLNALLRPGGWLGIMTCFLIDEGRFANWHYRRDPTHVVFYRPETFHHIAASLGWHCEIPVRDVALMRKSVEAARGTKQGSMGEKGDDGATF